MIMTHSLPTLPYEMDALAPRMSRETLEYHYGKHLKTYIDNLNNLIAGSPFAEMPLEEICVKAEGPIFNNGAQAWNHIFFFNSFSPSAQAAPTGALADARFTGGLQRAIRQSSHYPFRLRLGLVMR